MLISINVDVDATLFYGLILLAIFLIFYVLFDTNYFITALLIVSWCKLRRKRLRIDDTTEYYGVCTTNDLDFYFNHMNNARYVREMDFARMHFYKRTGLYEMLFNKDGTSLQAAAHIRYRRPIVVLTPYKVTTRIMYWDKRNIYFEQQFITLSDGFVAAVAVCKQTILGMNVIEIMNKLLGNKNETDHPTPPPELEDFIHLNEKSSARLRKQNHVT